MSTIHVSVTGSGNVVNTAGRDLYIGAPTAEDRDNLEHLAGHVRRIWITDFLEHSVHHAALLGLGMRPELDAVEHPWPRLLQVTGEAEASVLPPEQGIGQVFSDVGGMLLILGEPGSGKTTTLLTLARECIERRKWDAAAPVPVVLNLSTWANSGRSIHAWMLREVGAHYFVGRTLARRWLKQHRLLLLLDGLDEVAEERRAACVEALHAFVEEYGVAGLAICCRDREYRALPVRLKLGGAVSLLPLDQDQIDAYLEAAGPELAGLRAALASDAELRALADSPLMLSIMSLAFRGAPAQALRFGHAAGRAALRAEIFTRYVDHMFALRGRADGGVPRARIETFLRWLASRMARQGETIFAIRLLQPAWLTRGQLVLYAAASRVAGTWILSAGVCLSLILAFAPYELAPSAGAARPPPVTAWGIAGFFGLATALMVVLCVPADYLRLRSTRHRPLSAAVQFLKECALFFAYLWICCLAAIAAVLWLYGVDATPVQYQIIAILGKYFGRFAIAFALFFGVKQGRGRADTDIGTAGPLVWRWRAAVRSAGLGLVAGVVYPDVSWATGLLIGLAFGGWRYAVPPAGTWAADSFRNAAVQAVKGAAYLSVTAFLVRMVASPWSTLADPATLLARAEFGLALFGIPAFLWFGGLDFVLHACLRAVLVLGGRVPLRLRGLLDHAVHLGLLQRAGGAYVFIHRFLQEHFAADAAASPRPVVRSPV